MAARKENQVEAKRSDRCADTTDSRRHAIEQVNPQISGAIQESRGTGPARRTDVLVSN